MTQEEMALLHAHVDEAKRRGMTFTNFCWGMTKTGVASKTDQGILATERGPNGYAHTLTQD